MPSNLRDRISMSHPVIGDNYRLLQDHDTLQPGDQTACVSTIMQYQATHRDWVSVMPSWESDIGKRIDEILNPNSQDADWTERLFRRKL